MTEQVSDNDLTQNEDNAKKIADAKSEPIQCTVENCVYSTNKLSNMKDHKKDILT